MVSAGRASLLDDDQRRRGRAQTGRWRSGRPLPRRARPPGSWPGGLSPVLRLAGRCSHHPPIIAILLALVPRLPAGKRSGGGGSVDVRGALLVTTGIAALIFGLSSGQQHGFTSPATLIALALRCF